LATLANRGKREIIEDFDRNTVRKLDAEAWSGMKAI
jgi:hypothetical protein